MLLKIAAINPPIKAITRIITTATQPPAIIADIIAFVVEIIAFNVFIVACTVIFVAFIVA